MKHKTKNDLKTVIAAIEGSGGIKTVIARRLGVVRNTVDNYLNRWASAREAYTREQEKNMDMAESIIFGNMRIALKQQQQNGNTEIVDSGDAWKFIQYKGAPRGYIHTQRNENTTVDLSNLTDSQLDRLAKGDDLYAVLTTPRTGAN